MAGIYGAGGPSAGDNPALKSIINQLGGSLFSPNQRSATCHYLIDGIVHGKAAMLFGYSRGGNSAIKIANLLGRQQIPILHLVTFDAHSLIDGRVFQLKYNNIEKAQNFYQKNPRTAGKYGWWGKNPYWGGPLFSPFIEVQQFDFTGSDYKKGIPVSHLNIVRKALASL
ncbi:hypothetical protein MO867_14695 [Microbulbifer sp. OS29]|uniref:Uncharacterized protein n=1 Tax=Microbulbifer okhotskensis TaxID=2926617 RepID=A0A9X2EQP2_9GAMM|nr:hypothetical protein [Microbulbifer okhotskensis]MCO1335585.1 hypothetical protein [Microbulbifer okhotskensis]